MRSDFPRHAARCSSRALIDGLEPRQLLSTITWTNRGVTTGANDDRFDDVFGSLQNQARAVIDAAIQAWQRTIVNFNYGGANPNNFNITISMNPTAVTTPGTGVGANGGFNASINGKPSAGFMNIGWRSGVTPGTNSAAGWYLDPTPTDSSEFQGTFFNAFGRGPTAAINGGDLFTGSLHELGHAMGLASTAQTQAASFDTNSSDNQNTPASNPPSTLWAYNNNGSLWTEWDSGGAGGAAGNFAGPQHFAPLNTSAVVFGSTRVGAVALMNASFTNRCMISDIEADCARIAYGYTIATPSTFGTTYGQLDNDGTLRVDTTSLNASNDVIDIRPSGANLQLTITPTNRVATIDPLGSITSLFPTGAVQRIVIDAGDGDDFVRIFPNGTIPVTVIGNTGADTLEGHGAVNAFDEFVTTGSSLTATGLSITSFSSISTLRLFTEGGPANLSLTGTGSITSAEVLATPATETINLRTLDSGTPMVIFAGDGGDTINIQPDSGSGLIKSPVTIHGGNGDDVVNIGPVGFASSLVTQPITFNGDADNDTMVIGANNADAMMADFTFNGGTTSGAAGNRIIYDDTAPAYILTYDIGPSTITRTGLSTRTLTYSGISRVVINGGLSADVVTVQDGASLAVEAYGNDGNDSFDIRGGATALLYGGNGNDSFVFGGGNLGPAISSVTAFGGPGSDKMTLDDHQSTHSSFPWAVFGNTGDPNTANTVFLALNAYSYNGFEALEVLGGMGSNDFQIYSSSVPVTLRGGGGDDSFRFLQTADNIIDMTIDGQTGFNTLTADDRNFVFGMTVMELSDTYMRRWSGLVPMTSYYSNIQSLDYFAHPDAVTTYIYGTSAAVPSTHQYSLFLGNNADTVVVYPEDGGGNLRINGNLGIGGGGGTDSIFVSAAGAPAGMNVSFSNPFGSGTQSIFGLGSAGLGVGSVENITITGSSGSDTFAVNEFTSGAALAINGGPGNDALNFGANSLAPITNMASFNFDGQDGYDTFYLNNQVQTGTWSYGRALNLIAASNTLGAYYTMNEANIELLRINGGPSAETFNVGSSTAGGMILDAGAGIDVLILGAGPNNVDGIQAAVNFVAGPDGGRVEVLDTADTTGDTFHLDQQFLNGVAGDNLFGPGGFLSFSGLTDIGPNPALSINCGSGSDTAYAQPLVNGTTTINFGAQNRTPGELIGDQLNLALAAAQNYVVNGTTAGNVTSSNTGQLNWTGVDLPVAVDDVAPSVVASSFLYDAPAMAVTHRFSEPVSPWILISLTINNLTTSQAVPYSTMAFSYDAGTSTQRVTFPGYANGALPDGNYRIDVAAGYVVDLFGNLSTGANPIDTFVLAGDANRDRSVNIGDFSVLASHFNQPGTFALGDFNYSGVVEIGDFAILASKFNTTLPVARPAATPASVNPDPAGRGGSPFAIDRIEHAIDAVPV